MIAEAVLLRFSSAVSDFQRDWPLRVAVICQDGRPVWMVSVLLHMAIDARQRSRPWITTDLRPPRTPPSSRADGRGVGSLGAGVPCSSKYNATALLSGQFQWLDCGDRAGGCASSGHARQVGRARHVGYQRLQATAQPFGEPRLPLPRWCQADP
jgi:hypothetical protein